MMRQPEPPPVAEVQEVVRRLDTTPVPGAVPARVLRVIHLGFEVRVEMEAEGHRDLWVQLSRHDPILSVLGPGLDVWARAIPRQALSSSTSP